MDGVMWAFAKKNTQLKEFLFFTVKFACLKLSKYCAEVTPTMSLLLISAHIRDPFQRLPLFRQRDMGMDNNREEETF